MPSTIESTTRTRAPSGMSSSTEGGKSMGWCCMQGLNVGDAILPPDLKSDSQIILYTQVKSHFIRTRIDIRNSKTIIWEAEKGRPAKTFHRSRRAMLCNSFDTAPFSCIQQLISVPRAGNYTLFATGPQRHPVAKPRDGEITPRRAISSGVARRNRTPRKAARP